MRRGWERRSLSRQSKCSCPCGPRGLCSRTEDVQHPLQSLQWIRATRAAASTTAMPGRPEAFRPSVPSRPAGTVFARFSHGLPRQTVAGQPISTEAPKTGLYLVRSPRPVPLLRGKERTGANSTTERLQSFLQRRQRGHAKGGPQRVDEAIKGAGKGAPTQKETTPGLNGEPADVKVKYSVIYLGRRQLVHAPLFLLTRCPEWRYQSV